MPSMRPATLLLLAACAAGDDDRAGPGDTGGDGPGVALDGPLGPGSTRDEIAPGVHGCAFDPGVEALWSLAVGVPPDLSGVATPDGTWSSYLDPDVPLIGFFHPPGWVPTRVADGVVLGVDLAQTGTQGFWRLLYVLYPRGDLTSAQIEADQLAALGAADGTVMCRLTARSEGIVGQEATLTAVQDGDRIVLLSASTVYDTGSLGYGQGVTVNAQIEAWVASDRAFPQLTRDVFLPLVFQFYRGGGGDLDSDGDGIPDDGDAFPYDPERS